MGGIGTATDAAKAAGGHGALTLASTCQRVSNPRHRSLTPASLHPWPAKLLAGNLQPRDAGRRGSPLPGLNLEPSGVMESSRCLDFLGSGCPSLFLLLWEWGCPPCACPPGIFGEHRFRAGEECYPRMNPTCRLP